MTDSVIIFKIQHFILQCSSALGRSVRGALEVRVGEGEPAGGAGGSTARPPPTAPSPRSVVCPTVAFGAIVGLELRLSRRLVAGEARAVVAARRVGAAPPLAADVRHILALVVICGGRKVRLTSTRRGKMGVTGEPRTGSELPKPSVPPTGGRDAH